MVSSGTTRDPSILGFGAVGEPGLQAVIFETARLPHSLRDTVRGKSEL